jgi:hypothetical protein
MTNVVSISYSPEWESTSDFPAGGNDESRRVIIAAPEWQVRERWFAADVSLQAGSLSAHYARTPLIDYAMALRYSLEMLAVDDVSSFPASGGPRLEMARNGGTVDIRQSGRLTSGIEFADLVSACAYFRRKFIDEATSRYPEILLNGLIESLFRESGLREKDRNRFKRHSDAVKLRNRLA